MHCLRIFVCNRVHWKLTRCFAPSVLSSVLVWRCLDMLEATTVVESGQYETLTWAERRREGRRRRGEEEEA